MVDVTGTEGLLETAPVAFLWCPSVAAASGRFTMHGDLGQAMIFHPWKRALPSVVVSSTARPQCW